MRRTLKGYDGTAVTTRHISELLPQQLSAISAQQNLRPEVILAMWPQIIGPKLAPMTTAERFQEGILHVKVRNSTLYSLLQRYEKARILQQLRETFPEVAIHGITFRIG